MDQEQRPAALALADVRDLRVLEPERPHIEAAHAADNLIGRWRTSARPAGDRGQGQRVWADEHTWEVSNDPDERPKAYVLEMLPYPLR